jgi:hypothetical protein
MTKQDVPPGVQVKSHDWDRYNSVKGPQEARLKISVEHILWPLWAQCKLSLSTQVAPNLHQLFLPPKSQVLLLVLCPRAKMTSGPDQQRKSMPGSVISDFPQYLSLPDDAGARGEIRGSESWLSVSTQWSQEGCSKEPCGADPSHQTSLGDC